MTDPRPYHVVGTPTGYVVSRRCMACNAEHEAFVTSQQLWAFEHGTLAQYAFPTLRPREREALFISGICCF